MVASRPSASPNADDQKRALFSRLLGAVLAYFEEHMYALPGEVVWPTDVTRLGEVQVSGSRTVKVAPPPGVSVTAMVPAWASTRAATIDRPRPEPPVDRVRAESAR